MSSPSFNRAAQEKHVSAGNRTQVAYVAGEHSSKELFEQLMILLFGTSTWLPQCMWLTGC